MATFNRKNEIERFCEALSKQTYKNFELIIVDQNLDKKLNEIILKYSIFFKIKHLRSAVTGLSYNRNIGLKYAEGNVIAFPDDDCEYQQDTLQKIVETFVASNKDFIACNSMDYNCGISHFVSSIHDITFRNIYQSGISFTIFIKSSCLKDFKFDEQLGVGALFGAGEETDLIAYLLSRNKNGKFYGDIYIHHPYKKNNYDLDRCKTYALGFGALYKKLIKYYKMPTCKTQFLVAILKNVIALIFCRHKKYYFISLKYKLQGFKLYIPDSKQK